MKIEIIRSYARKIKFGDSYEMSDIFASYKEEVEGTEVEIRKRSDELHRMAREDVEIKVDILQNPQKVIRGYASITEMRNKIRLLEEDIKKLKEEKANQVPFKS